jgi:NADH-quinone oxidoreductase subunit L
MKKILAYSTVSQLGFMFAAVGVGFFAAGFFHVFTHAFFKACLFLGAGSVMHAVHAHGDADIFKLGGLKKYMPTTRWTFLASCLAIAGFPLTSGFFSKDEILLGAAAQIHRDADSMTVAVGWFVLVGLTLAAVMTAFYMFRLYFLTFTGEYRSADQSGDHPYDAHPHESPPSMAIPLVVLGVGALVVGFLGLPHVMPITGIHLPSWWSHWMHSSVAGQPVPEELGVVNLASGCAFAAMAVGIGSAWALYRNKSEDALQQTLPARLYQLAFDKWRVDELYGAVVVGPIKKVATVAGHADMTFVDALMTKLPSFSTKEGGAWLAKLQNGVVHVYGAVMAVGIVGIIAWYWMPHPRIEADFSGATAELTSAPGLGYQYRWDANSDGEFDTGWSASPGTTFEYREEDVRNVILVLTNAATGARHEMDLSDEWQLLPLTRVTDERELSPSDSLTEFRRDGDELVIRLPGWRAQGGKPREVRRGLGQVARFGQVIVTTASTVEATVEVKNAFGNVNRESAQLVLPTSVRAASRAALTQSGQGGRL